MLRNRSYNPMWRVEWIAAFVAFPVIIAADWIINTKSGIVQGTSAQVSFERDVKAFLGIPFAEPPVGKLRFRKPFPIRPWANIYNATALPPPCYQNYTEKLHWTPNVERMSEDCLYLNLWVPVDNRVNAKLKPVLIFIHGGAFNIGSSEMDIYDGSVLASRGDVVICSFNYRVGVFGFLSSDSQDAPGNMGIYDQILALKWFKENIKAFGGDPELITLIGESAGAMSIGLHLISPLTKGLFKRAIMESGGSIHPKSAESKRATFDLSEEIAKFCGCSDDTVSFTTDPQVVVDCLKHVPSNLLSESEGIFMKLRGITFLPFWGEKFMPRNPIDLMREGLIQGTEVLIGSNADEGSVYLTSILRDYLGVYGHGTNPKLSRHGAEFLIKSIFKQTEQTDVKDIANFYVSNSKKNLNSSYNSSATPMVKHVFNSLGDYFTLCPSVFFADFFSLGEKPVYFYMFSHRPTFTYNAEWMGVTHFEELQYVFGLPFRKENNYSDDDKVISMRMMNRWLSFAKTGNPNIPGTLEWPPYKWNNPVYMDIKMKEEIKVKPDEYRCEFWRDRFQADLNSSVTQRYQTSTASSIKANVLVAICFALMSQIYVAS